MIRPILLMASLVAATVAQGGDGKVTLLRTPPGTFQPQAIADAEGNVHLVALKGDAGASDVEYYRLRPTDSPSYGPALRVNSQPKSAVGAGTIRGAQMALGPDGRGHIIWNGADKAEPRNSFGGSPILYTRSDPKGTAFEPQRNVMVRTSVLDGGATVAADREGRVYVAW